MKNYFWGDDEYDDSSDYESGNSYTEVENVSWFSRLKESIGSAVGGGILFLASFVILFSNEGCSVKNAKAIETGAKSVISLSSIEKIDPANNGKLVHFTGPTKLSQKITDPDMGVSVDAIKLQRTVEMYQWQETSTTKKEKKLGGGEKRVKEYKYKKAWSSSLIDSSNFKIKKDHSNPSSIPYKNNVVINESIMVGTFKIPSDLFSSMSGFEPLKINTDNNYNLNSTISNIYKIQPDGTLYKGNPDTPEIGDIRISFETVPSGDVSIIAAQNGSTVAPHQTTSDRTTYVISRGSKTADQMFTAQAEANKMMTWLLRFGGFLAMAIGLYMVFKPLSTIADVIPFLGSLLSFGLGIFAGLIAFFLSLITIAIAWLFYRPLLAIILLVIGIGGIVGWQIYAKKKKTAEA